jgi:hypothetical protein
MLICSGRRVEVERGASTQPSSIVLTLQEWTAVVNIDEIYRRYQELQGWVGWTGESARRVAATAELLEPHLILPIDDFYDELSVLQQLTAQQGNGGSGSESSRPQE